MYNTRDLNIILKRSGPDTIKNETYHFEYCVPEGMDCHVSGKRETIDASNLETITMQVFHLADSLKIHIRINPWSTSDWTVNTINIAGRDEVIIEY